MIHIILMFKSMYVNPYLSFRSKKVDTVTFVFKNTFCPYKQKLYFAMHLFPKHAAKYSLIFSYAECGEHAFYYQQIFPPSSLPGLPSAVLNGIS